MKFILTKKPVLRRQDKLLSNTQKVLLLYALPLLILAGITYLMEQFSEKMIKAD